MKPTFVPHEEYQKIVMDQLQKHYSGGILTLVNGDWPVITKLRITDLTGITTMLTDTYGKTGPSPRDPSSMLRSYLLFILTNPTMGITKWVEQLKRVPFMPFLADLNQAIRMVLERIMTFLIVYGSLIKRMSPIKRKVRSLVNVNPRKVRKGKRHPYLNLAG